MPENPETPVALRARRHITLRLMPFLFVMYIIAYLDRVNVSFANLEMSRALSFTDAQFGLGAGLFFIGYFLLEIPGAIIVERWSARKWLARAPSLYDDRAGDFQQEIADEEESRAQSKLGVGEAQGPGHLQVREADIYAIQIGNDVHHE